MGLSLNEIVGGWSPLFRLARSEITTKNDGSSRLNDWVCVRPGFESVASRFRRINWSSLPSSNLTIRTWFRATRSWSKGRDTTIYPRITAVWANCNEIPDSLITWRNKNFLLAVVHVWRNHKFKNCFYYRRLWFIEHNIKLKNCIKVVMSIRVNTFQKSTKPW